MLSRTSRRRFLKSLLFPGLPLFVLLPSIALADVTAEYALDTVGSSFGPFGSEAFIQGRGQVFEAEVAGEVTSISLRAGRIQEHDVDLVLSLHAENAGVPAGEALAQSTVTASQIPVGGAGGVVKADFTGSQVELEAGTRYVVTAVPAFLEPNNNTFFLNGSLEEEAEYDGGAACFLESGSWGLDERDWAFQVEVGESTPVESVSWGSVKKSYWFKSWNESIKTP